MSDKVGRCTGGGSGRLKFITKKGGGGDFHNMHIVCMDCSSEEGACSENSLAVLSEGKPLQKCTGYHPGEGQSSCSDEQGKDVWMQVEPRGAQSNHIVSHVSALDISMERGVDSEKASIRSHQAFEFAKKSYLKMEAEKGKKIALDAASIFAEQIATSCNIDVDAVLKEMSENDFRSPDDAIEDQVLNQSDILERISNTVT